MHSKLFSVLLANQLRWWWCGVVWLLDDQQQY